MSADEFVTIAMQVLLVEPPCASAPQNLLNGFWSVASQLSQDQLEKLLYASLTHAKRYQEALMKGSLDYDCMESLYNIHAFTNAVLTHVNLEALFGIVHSKREKGGDLELL